jgi:putative addiction module CopG family antidote
MVNRTFRRVLCSECNSVRFFLGERSMNVHLPDEFNEIVNHLVERGRFQSGEEAVAEGPRLLVSREQLREEVAQGFQQIDEGWESRVIKYSKK